MLAFVRNRATNLLPLSLEGERSSKLHVEKAACSEPTNFPIDGSLACPRFSSHSISAREFYPHTVKYPNSRYEGFERLD
jgi:hypothetical protein